MRAITILVCAAVFVSCRPGSPAPRPVTENTRAVTPPDSLAGPWRFTASGSLRAQRLLSAAELVSTIDTLTRRDSLEAVTLLSWSADSAHMPGRVSGSVRGFAVRVGGDSAWRELVGEDAPIAFAAERAHAAGAPELVMPPYAECSAEAAAVQAWRETWVAPPPEVVRGSSWRDSSETALCRDGIVLRGLLVRTFTADSAIVRDGRLRVLVHRRSRVVLRGAGLQFGDSVRIEAAGDGDATLELLPGSGAIARGDGRSELRMTLQGRRRTQSLVQHGALVISQP